MKIKIKHFFLNEGVFDPPESTPAKGEAFEEPTEDAPTSPPLDPEHMKQLQEVEATLNDILNTLPDRFELKKLINKFLQELNAYQAEEVEG